MHKAQYRFDRGEFADYDDIKKERNRYRKRYKRLKKAIKKNTVKIGHIIINGDVCIILNGKIYGNIEIDGNFRGGNYEMIGGNTQTITGNAYVGPIKELEDGTFENVPFDFNASPSFSITTGITTEVRLDDQ